MNFLNLKKTEISVIRIFTATIFAILVFSDSVLAQSVGICLNNINNYVNQNEIEEDTSIVPSTYYFKSSSANVYSDLITKQNKRGLFKRFQLGYGFSSSTRDRVVPRTNDYYLENINTSLHRIFIGIGIGKTTGFENFRIYSGIELLNEYDWKNLREMNGEILDYSHTQLIQSNQIYKYGKTFAFSLLGNVAPYYCFGRFQLGFEFRFGFRQYIKYSSDLYKVRIEDFQTNEILEDSIVTKNKDSNLGFTNYFLVGLRYSIHRKDNGE